MPRGSVPTLTLPTELKMADCLEDLEPGDSDRRIDACGFRRQQFDIFKNKFRDAFDEHGHEKLANLVLDGTLKKDVVNTMRRLQRAKFTLENVNEQEAVGGLVKKISELYDEIGRATKGNDEFTVDNVKLPDYDETALDLIFGGNPPKENEVSITNVQELNKAFTEKINEVLGAAQLLLNEYDELMEYLKRGGVPLSPLPK
ncbi:unnamed protein product [Bursaphelenchus xylophilus]|uniref:(pine wood nematode) hypothetical protein n=1 Tax=Bursaphelenchus xylophilus TaxID=6326 RepID=A0A1I7RPV0_BURXY|nr:unnamed protein product [Bursaphelenchus xylophilus]CAG9096669.1 unnamed protein product [Bursaphelenchus xylophilus]